ncbi:MAG: lactate utilization protein, partial [Candidatus Eremiobacteraeota bacterium]|nr:lactate utilization protein [Candidatus Eremiobacteraeota bacterium]
MARDISRAFQRPDAPPVLTRTLEHSVDNAHRAREQIEWHALRSAAHDIKKYAIEHLDSLLVEFERQFTARGGTVLWAQTADEGIAQLLEICRRYDVRTVVKGKSMVSEELGVNEHLERAGIEPVETDLGEFIVQLAGQRP